MVNIAVMVRRNRRGDTLKREVVPGAKGRDRTADPSIFSAVLYRLSYLGAGR